MKLRKSRVQWELMLPDEYRRAMTDLPVCFLPLGNVEWHGEHNALGLDALKVHALCCAAAERVGGVVHPPVYGGIGGHDMPATVMLEPVRDRTHHLLRPLIERLVSEFIRLEFRAVIVITGHLNPAQQAIVKESSLRMTQWLKTPVWGVAESWLAQDVGYVGDHARAGETALMSHLYPDLVALDRLSQDPHFGKDDSIKRDATRRFGRQISDQIVERLSAVATAMPRWKGRSLSGFVTAEQAVARFLYMAQSAQNPAQMLERARTMAEYGPAIADGRFDDVVRLADRLLLED